MDVYYGETSLSDWYIQWTQVLFIAMPSHPALCVFNASVMKHRGALMKTWVMVYSPTVSRSYQHTVLTKRNIHQRIVSKMSSKRPYYLNRTETGSDVVSDWVTFSNSKSSRFSTKVWVEGRRSRYKGTKKNVIILLDEHWL